MGKEPGPSEVDFTHPQPPNRDRAHNQARLFYSFPGVDRALNRNPLTSLLVSGRTPVRPLSITRLRDAPGNISRQRM